MVSYGNKWFMVAWLSVVMYNIHIEDCTDLLKFIILIRWR